MWNLLTLKESHKVGCRHSLIRSPFVGWLHPPLSVFVRDCPARELSFSTVSNRQ